MTFTCSGLEGALRENDEARLAAAREHALTCAACAGALQAWDAVSVAAAGMRRSWESPELWPRIHQALAEESQRRQSTPTRFFAVSKLLPIAAAVLFALGVVGPLVRHAPEVAPPVAVATDDELLGERALAEVERSEAAYTASIDRLARVAAFRLDTPAPVFANYREKLQILDAAIAECRAQIDGNRWNAHLRQELLSIYQEKQRTLERIMEERS